MLRFVNINFPTIRRESSTGAKSVDGRRPVSRCIPHIRHTALPRFDGDLKRFGHQPPRDADDLSFHKNRPQRSVVAAATDQPDSSRAERPFTGQPRSTLLNRAAQRRAATKTNKVNTALQPPPEKAPSVPRAGALLNLRRSGRTRKHVARFKQSIAARAAVPMRCLFGRRLSRAFGILMYHRTSPRVPGVVEPTWNVTPQRFRGHLQGLISAGYQAWPLRTAIEHANEGRPVPRNVFVVTIDDGYASNYHYAWPILKELNIPATIFLATAYLDSGTPFPFDDWAAAGSPAVPVSTWRPLSTSQCAEMLEDGLVDVGAHTHTHGDFRQQPEALYEDLRTSLEVLRTRLALSQVAFAFPYGTRRAGFSGPLLAEAAKQAGVLSALTTEEELVTPASCPFDWGRFAANQVDTPTTLAAKLDGWYTAIRDVWRTARRPVTCRRARA